MTNAFAEPVGRLRVPGHGEVGLFVPEVVPSRVALGLRANGRVLGHVPLDPPEHDVAGGRVAAEDLGLPSMDAGRPQAKR